MLQGIADETGMSIEEILEKSLADPDWAIAGGLAAGSIDILSLGIIGHATGLTKVGSKLITKGAARLGVKKAIKDVAKDVVTKKTKTQLIKDIGKGIAVSTVSEYFQEGTQGQIEGYTAAKGGGREFDLLSEENMSRFWLESFAGGVMGMGMGTGGSALSASFQQLKKVDKKAKEDDAIKEEKEATKKEPKKKEPEPDEPIEVEEVEEQEEQEEQEEEKEATKKDNPIVTELYEKLKEIDDLTANILVEEFEGAGEIIPDSWVEDAEKAVKAKQAEAEAELEAEKESIPTTMEDGKPKASIKELVRVPLISIEKDLKRFQDRRHAYSEESVKSIVDAIKNGTFDIQEFDQIRLWKDPKNNKTYILAGHSREKAWNILQEEGFDSLSPEAQKNLRDQGIENFDEIEAEFYTGDEKKAISFATERSNTMATAPSNLDIADRWRKLRIAGEKKKDIEAKMAGRTNLPIKERLSYLNPRGKAWLALEAFEGRDSEGSRIEKIGEFIGAARQRHSVFTDSHENEMYDWLLEGPGKRFTVRQDFMVHMDNIADIATMEPDKPLNLASRKTMGDNEASLRQEINKLHAQRDSARDRLKKAIEENRTETEKETQREIDKIKAEIIRLKGQMQKAKDSDKAQIDIFAPPKVEKEKLGDKEAEYEKELNRPYEQLTTEEEKKAEYDRISGNYPKIREAISRFLDVREKLDENRLSSPPSLVTLYQSRKKALEDLDIDVERIESDWYKDGAEKTRANYQEQYSEENRWENKVARKFGKEEKKPILEEEIVPETTEETPPTKPTEQTEGTESADVTSEQTLPQNQRDLKKSLRLLLSIVIRSTSTLCRSLTRISQYSLKPRSHHQKGFLPKMPTPLPD
jgi:hypothetical protein